MSKPLLHFVSFDSVMGGSPSAGTELQGALHSKTLIAIDMEY